MSRHTLFLWMRHQTGAFVSTVVDFLVMIAWVEVIGGSPVFAAGLGSGSGAVTNFTLGRMWIFRAHHHAIPAQAFRYVLIAGGSLLLNSLGQYLLVRRLGVAYVLSRVLVALVVGLSWNFPLHRYFVFPREKPHVVT